MPDEQIRLFIDVGEPAPNARADASAQSLLDELSTIPRLRLKRAESPSLVGAKSAGNVMAEVIVGLGTAHALLPTLVNAVRDWLLRQPPKTKLKVKLGKFEMEWIGPTPPQEVLNALVKATSSGD